MNGLDIQADCIRLIQCKKTRRGIKILKIVIIDTPDGIFNDGKIVGWDRLETTLKKLFIQNKITKQTNICLPIQLIRLQTLQLPANLSDCEIETEINLQIQNEFPGMPDELIYDFVVVPTINSGHVTVFFAATRQAYLSKYLACLQSIGLTINSIDVDVYAIGRALYHILPIHALTTEIKVLLCVIKQYAWLMIFDSLHLLYQQQWDRMHHHTEQIIQYCCNHMKRIKAKKIILCGEEEYRNLFIFKEYDFEFYVLPSLVIPEKNESHKHNYQLLIAFGLAIKGIK